MKASTAPQLIAINELTQAYKAIPIEDFSIKGNEINAYYKKSNSDESSISIVYIHGWGSSSLNWYYQLTDTETFGNYDQYFIDLTGHGVSSDFESITDVGYSTYSELIGSFIESKNLKNVVIVSHSMGAAIAKQIQENSSIIKKVYINPAVRSFTVPKFLCNFIYKSFLKKRIFRKRFLDSVLRNNIIMNIWANKMGDKLSKNSLNCNLITKFDMLNTKPTAFWGYLSNMNNVNPDLNDYIHLTKKEFLIVTQNDPTLPSELKQKNTFLVNNGGHCLPRTNPVTLNSLILKIVKSI